MRAKQGYRSARGVAIQLVNKVFQRPRLVIAERRINQRLV